MLLAQLPCPELACSQQQITRYFCVSSMCRNQNQHVVSIKAQAISVFPACAETRISVWLASNHKLYMCFQHVQKPELACGQRQITSYICDCSICRNQNQHAFSIKSQAISVLNIFGYHHQLLFLTLHLFHPVSQPSQAHECQLSFFSFLSAS